MQLPDRFIVVQPAGLDPTLARAAQAAGSWAMIDATRPGERRKVDQLDPERTVLRVEPDAPVDPDVGLAALAPWRIEAEHVPDLRAAVDRWLSAGVPVAVEVRTREEGRRALEAGADVLVARGGEGPGRASDRSSLVLLPALNDLDAPVIAWGGAGPNATGALLVHADAVVLDTQLYLLDEAGLPEAWHRTLGAFGGGDVRALGTTLGEPYNVLARPADEHVHERWQAEQASTEGPAARRRAIREAIEAERASWAEDPRDGLAPIGNDAAHASFFERFDDLDQALGWLAQRVEAQLTEEGFPLTGDNPLAEDHGTEHPIVQGAMANVSEVPAFASEVADAGALPFLAFASLREHWAAEALEGTIEALDDDQSFGCGIIGLDVNATKRDAHMRLIEEHKPPYALIAAGTADQARSIEQAGVDTYMHTPSPGIVRQALDVGLSRVVVEGNECGGHIGKLPSLVLWDQALQEIEAKDLDRDVHVLLAGGIGDEDTAAMAGTLAAGTQASVGVLMGTAYLATEEIVETGAVPDTYQDLVLATKETEVTGETIGIRARSAPTPFTTDLTDLEQRMLDEGVDLDQRKETFEHENLGATRLAARGVRRDDEGTYHEVPIDEQLQDGNYLMGQGAELIDERYTIEELHERVTDGAAEVVDRARSRLDRPLEVTRPEADETPPEGAIAIVGLGCVLPDAPDVDAFWNNLLAGRVSIDTLPEDRWPISPEIHHRPGEPDGTDTLLGAFVEDDPFDPIEYRIPPAVADQMDAAQRWAIEAVDQALADANLEDRDQRDRWAVILGNAQGERRSWTDRRLALREAIDRIEKSGLPDDALEQAIEPLDELLETIQPINEDTMPGELSNVVAGRICNVFDIGGPARTIDTACASSLAATEEAVRQLRDGEVDVAITGGVDHSMDPSAYTKFSAIGALSSEGSFPFDERASGFVMGEGCGVLVLKRLEDARSDGDRIYAVIEGVASSSDGSGQGITAPDQGGQARAIRRAWADAEVDPTELDFVEAHGTGTPVGDPIEASTLEAMLEDADPRSVAVGSVKANIGHLKTAAGAAGLLKATLAIHNGQLPPTPVETPTSEVDWDTSPLALALETIDLGRGPVRGGVSAFGFGGTNSHVVLASPPAPSQRDERETADVPVQRASAADAEGLLREVERSRPSWDASDPIRAAWTDDADTDAIAAAASGDLPTDLALSKGVCLARDETGQLGLVFPGQGSQYPGMVLDLADRFPAAREVLERADQVLTPLLGQPLSEILALEGEEGKRALTPTEVCQPAVLTCDVAVLRVLEERGLEPDVVAGHSLGEYAALVAAGVFTLEDALHAVSARGREMAGVEVDDPGGLVALRADHDEASDLIDGLDAWPANVNGPQQTVVAGTTPALERIQERAEEAGIQASRLPVSAAFHSPIVAPATEPLREVLERIPVDEPEIPVIANATGEAYPADPHAIRDLLAEQVASAVRWTDTMAAFDERGVELVVEAGPKRVLTNLARANLDTLAVPTADPKAGVDEAVDRAFAALAAHDQLDLGTSETASPAPSPTRRPDRAEPTASEPAPSRRSQARARQVVVSGVSLGLPTPDGSDPFGQGSLASLLEGDNRIDRVPDAIREQMAGMGVTRLDKSGPGGPTLEEIEDPDEVVQLAGRLPEVDLASYDADEDWLADADPTSRLAVAAALEALDDASIPLVPDTRETSTGTTLADGWTLPEPMQDETGVVFASAFPGDASLVEAVSEAAQRHRRRSADPSALIDGVKRLSEHIDTPEGEAELLDWVAETHTSTPVEAPEGESFPRDFLFQALAMGHAQVAQLIDARGPNLQVNAACASTTAAIALAQDWIEQGRCERVIVVGADVAGNDELLPWIGSGFLAAGAATTSDEVEEAALPFDERRHGMLVGSGAVGLVLETAEAADRRGVQPIANLVEAHVANSAYHGARLDPDHVAEQVERVVEHGAERLEIDRQQLADELVFVSHEPATPKRGGSAEAEVRALRRALDGSADDVLVTNTKGLTGHAMGAGIEDGIAVELLRARRAPPVANLEQVDPDFTDLTFSQGQRTDRSLSLRFAAGFGSQVALALFQRASETPGELDRPIFDDWLETAVGPSHELTTRDRLLRAIPEGNLADAPTQTQASTTAEPETQPEPASQPEPTPTTGSSDGAADEGAVRDLLAELVSKKTGYPEDVIEPEMNLEADLGVDTVKQAEVLSEAREELGIPPIDGMSLSDVPTLDDAASLLAQHTDDGPGKAAPDAELEPEPDTGEPEPAPGVSASESGSPEPGTSTEAVRELLTDLVSKKTGYPEDVIEPEMNLEADLGVDTVKQAEVLSEAREELGIPPIDGMSLSDVPTLEDAASLLAEHAGSPTEAAGEPTDEDGAPPSEEPSDQPSPMQVLSTTEAPAPAADGLRENARVAIEGPKLSGLEDALEERGAQIDQGEPDVVVVRLPSSGADPDRMAETLHALQAVPEGPELVLLADADDPSTRGLPALAATLTAEDRPTRAIAVEPGTPSEQIADEILAQTDASVRLASDERRTRLLAPATDAKPAELEPGAVVLAPGGLGAAVQPCLAALAEEHEVRIAVAGRSPLEDTDLDPDDEDQVDALRQELFDQARQEGDVRPAEVEETVQAHVKRARRAQAFEALDARAEVRYAQIDATDPDQLAEWTETVRQRWGEPDLVVHGVGFERSRAFEDKPRDEMQAVLATKLVPVAELTEHLPEAHHVAFGSIAGVTGNPGQADYALANGMLEGLLEPVDGTVIHWTAWDAAGGMADDDTVRTVLEDRGVRFLDPDEGASVFGDRFAEPGVHVVADLEPDTPLAATPDRALLAMEGDEDWLQDHSLGGRALVPGVRHLQAIVGAAEATGQRATALHDVRFREALWVTEPTQARVRLDDDQASVEQDGRTHATADLGPGEGTKPLGPVGAPEDGLGPDEIYEAFFHGPSFQVLETADAAPSSVRACADLGAGGAAPWALAIEACLQAAGLGDRAAEADLGLPAAIEEIDVARDPRAAEATVHAQLVQRDLVGSTWDATVRGPDEEVLVTVRGLRLRGMGSTSRWIDALGALTDGPTEVRIARVPPHDPRDPRAKRTAERQAGTDAAERALEELHGEPVGLERVDGRPVPETGEGGVSITHSHGIAVAAAHPTDPVGVDLEAIEPRSDAWLADHFTDDERAAIGAHELGEDGAATLVWTLKEAASKATGTGFDVPADRLRVALDGERATIETPGGTLEGRWIRHEGAIVSLVGPSGTSK